MAKKDYSNLTKDQLLEVIEKLEGKKKYGLVWDEERVPEKVVTDCQDKLPVLTEVKGKEIITDENEPTHILIEGDNYHALSVLNYTHKGKIDLIYIDPPYNTGYKDFIYNDKYVEKEDTWRHSKWLQFMNKRLILAKELLTDKGLIFISIDDNEIGQLKLLCDDIFSEEKLMGIIHWRKNRKPHNASGTISKSAEFILVYAKNEKIKLVQEYTLKGNNEKGNFSEGPIIKADKKERIYIFPKGLKCEAKNIEKGINTSARNPKLYIEYLDKPIIENGILQNNVKIKGRYCVTNERGMLSREIEKGNVFINKNGVPKLITYREELLGKVANNLWIDKGYNEDANEEIKELFDVDLASEVFNYPKPTELVKEIGRCINKKDALILDFFAGSGTTLHSILSLNNEDKGNRRVIICSSNENNNGNGKIVDTVMYPRVEKVIKGYKKKNGQIIEGLGNNLKYFKTSFVANNRNKDQLKIDITKRCTEMLCLKEGIFNLIREEADYKIFQQGNRYLAVYYDFANASLDELKEEMNALKGEKVLFCFTVDNHGLDKANFRGWKNIRLEPIPQKILDVYKRIFKN